MTAPEEAQESQETKSPGLEFIAPKSGGATVMLRPKDPKLQGDRDVIAVFEERELPQDPETLKVQRYGYFNCRTHESVVSNRMTAGELAELMMKSPACGGLFIPLDIWKETRALEEEMKRRKAESQARLEALRNGNRDRSLRITG